MSVASFEEQQRKLGFDTGKIEQLKRVVFGSLAAPSLVTTPNARAMLKRADGSLMAFTGMGYTTHLQFGESREVSEASKIRCGPGGLASL